MDSMKIDVDGGFGREKNDDEKVLIVVAVCDSDECLADVLNNWVVVEEDIGEF